MASPVRPSKTVLLGEDPRFRRLLEEIPRFAETDAPVLITGESGTGKELVARLIHHASLRRRDPLVAMNCGAIASNLEESELFGHVAGAFTGATGRKTGKIEAADGGTLFLDEAAEMSPGLQVKLLRVLANGEYSPVGQASTRRCDVRVVAATNKELKDAITDGEFRADLYYRLNVLRLEIPPLRRRPGDIPLLAEHFLRRFAQQYGRPKPRISADFEEQLMAYSFPGNVRELENLIHRALVLCRGERLRADLIPSEVLAHKPSDESSSSGTTPDFQGTNFHEAKQNVVEHFERHYLVSMLKECAGIVSRAAAKAGLSERNFHEKLNRYGIDGRSYRPT